MIQTQYMVESLAEGVALRSGLLKLEVLSFVFQKSGQHVAFGFILGFQDTCGMGSLPALAAIYSVCYQVLAWMPARPNLRRAPGSTFERAFARKYSVLLYTSYEYHEEYSLKSMYQSKQ